MTDTTKGFAAMIAACCIWGLSSIFYKLLSHVPAAEVLAHRTLWSLVFFIIVLTVQRRLRAVFDAMAGPRAFGLLAFAALVIATNWYLFISAVQSGQATEAALGYYIFPLVSVLLGRLVFGERLSPVQRVAPPLQTHLGDHRLLGDPWRAGDFDVEGIEREEQLARLKGRRHGRAKAPWVGALYHGGAGV